MTHRSRAALAIVLLAAACSGSSHHNKTSSLGSNQSINDGGTQNAVGKTSVEVTATNFKFSPSTIVATPGQVLKLIVHNTSSTPHNITQSTQNVNTDLDPGSTKTVMLTVPASGELVFWCEYHHASGMAGQIGPSTTAPGNTGGSSPTPYTNPYGNG